MSNNQAMFQSGNDKRRILIVEDERINLEILRFMLEDSYDLIAADTGKAALEMAFANSETLSLVLLDLNLPDMHGLDVLREFRADPRTSHIPVIVLTAEKDAEVESLTLGAIDFIPKPYPQPKVVLARVLRTIELCEDRDTIRSTERDHLTGLYSREYFYRYAAQFDLHHRDSPADALVLDINHFHMINERYGKARGDDVLRRVGEKLRESLQDGTGIACRLEPDVFLIYCTHREDYSGLLNNVSITLGEEGKSETRIRIRMGLYSNVDKTIDIERRFDRAKLAADTVKNHFAKSIGIYDDQMHESELFAEQLIEDFPGAIREKQFLVYFQPKFDIRPAEPVLTSAEALVRWKHPALGMVSPGAFIPLFENNGLIQELDEYIWNVAAEQVRTWKEQLGISVPVSVNVSRVDLYDPFFVEKIDEIVRKNSLGYHELLLEITESAYTDDSEQIIEKVRQLRSLGFKIEMDDFGSGYSSLNMLSSLPIDALKLDMQFIRSAFRERKDTRLMEAVIQLAASLEVPTIAEGVETAEQLLALKAMGCDIVQGYYFSRPLPADEFEQFVVHRKEQAEENRNLRKTKKRDKFTYEALHDPLTGLYNHTAFEILFHDSDKDHIAVLLANIDDFEAIRKRLGKAETDRLVKKVAEILRASFRSVDDICRLKEDEFVIIMTRLTSAMRPMVLDKIERINALLHNPEDGYESVSLSVGAAFSDRENPTGDIFEDADIALMRMKEIRQSGCAVY